MKKVLFPTDFSQASLNAFPYALQIAAGSDAEIVTMHIYSQPLAPTVAHFNFLHNNEGLFAWPEFDNYNIAVRTLRQIADDSKYDQVKLKHILKAGHPATEIINAAALENADIIVMGNSGASGLKELLKGCTAEQVINRSTIPVVAIPRNFSKGRIATILYIAYPGGNDEMAIRWINSFSRLLGAGTEILELRRQGEVPGMLLRPRLLKTGIARLKFWITGRPEEPAILQYILKNRVDAAAMSVRHKDFFQRLVSPGITARLAFHSPVPLITIPWP